MQVLILYMLECSRSYVRKKIAEIFIAPRRIKLSTSMASPFLGTHAVIKVEDKENDSGVPGLVSRDQELRKKFREDVQLLVKLKRRLRTSGSTQPPPPPPPPVQPSPPPPPPPPSPAMHHPWAKRPAIAPPPGFAGVRQPPLKQYQRKTRAPAQPHQPAAPNAHRSLGPPPVNAQSAWRSPQQAPDARRALVPSAPPPAHAGPGGMPPPLQRRSAPKPRHPAAKKKKPTVPCAVCGVLCMTAWHLEQHENGRKHQNKLACLAGEMNVQCQVCNVHLSGALNVEEHYSGKKHIWRLKLAGGA